MVTRTEIFTGVARNVSIGKGSPKGLKGSSLRHASFGSFKGERFVGFLVFGKGFLDIYF